MYVVWSADVRAQGQLPVLRAGTELKVGRPTSRSSGLTPCRVSAVSVSGVRLRSRRDTLRARPAQLVRQPLGRYDESLTLTDRASQGVLVTATVRRGQAADAAALKSLEQVCDTPKLSCTTDVSNHRMQRLLSRVGLSACDFIGELDPGDPELVYVKELDPAS